jgi:hypothetical protein
MIFPRPLIHRIISGNVTQTRRLARGDFCKWKQNTSYGVHTVKEVGQEEVARIIVTSVKRRAAWDVSESDAHREGFSNAQDLLAAWPGRRDVWVISFRLDKEHQPRYLAKRSEEGYVRERQAAMPNEPEAVSEAEQTRQTEKAHADDEQRCIIEAAARASKADLLSLGQRVDAAVERARKQGKQTTKHERVIKKRLMELESS